MTAAEQLDAAFAAEATDAEFAAFLAARPQITRADMAPTPGLCTCSGRYTIGDKPILIRHTSCDNGPAGSVSFIDGQVMHTSTLPALAEWIPVPPPPPELDMAVAAIVIRHMIDNLALHLVKLHPGTKKPMGNRWNDPAVHPALTADEAIAHHAAGGGLGVLLGPSHLIILDAENYAAVQALRDAGLRPVLYTAKGINTDVCVDPRTDKRGGGHFWLRYDEDFDRARLDNVPAAKIGNGGVVDVLAMPGCMAVVPPTALVEAGMWCYTADGAHPAWDAAHPVVDVPPEWLLDLAAACPAGLEALHASQGPKVRTAHAPVTEAQAELSSEIDAVPWAEIFALDDRIELWGDVDSECGDVEIHWRGADHRKSGVAHECERGTYIHVFSASMCAALGIDSAETTLSKMQLACRLRGVETTGAGFRSTAEHFGIEMPSKFGDFADMLDEAADRYEDMADDQVHCAGAVVEPDPTVKPEIVSLDPRVSRVNAWREVKADRDYWIRQAAQCRSVARQLRKPRAEAAQADGEVYTLGPVVGAETVTPPPAAAPAASDTETIIDAETVELPADSGAEPTPGMIAPDDAIQGEVVGDWERGDQDMWEKLAVIEAKLRGERDPATMYWSGMTPGLGRIANLAESRGIFYIGLIESILPRVSARVPAYVLIASRAGGTCDRSEVLGMGYNSLILGPPASGKSTTQRAAETAIPLGPGIAQVASGTAEGMTKEARDTVTSGGVPTSRILNTSVYAEADEFGGVKKELSRDGNAFAAFVNGAYFGGSVQGQTTSDSKRKVVIPPHSTRFASQIGAQPQLVGLLLAEAGSGLTARYAFAFAGSEYTDDLGSLYGKAVPSVLQAPMPWDPPEGTPFGFQRVAPSQPAVLVPAEGGAPDISGVDEILFEAVPPESIDPVWITVPLTDEERKAARDESARRSRNTRQALTEDRESGRTAGHDGVRIQKAAVLLALLDGLTTPERVHLEAAQLLAEATALACAEAKIQSDSEDDEQNRKRGRGNGIAMAEGKAVANQAERDSVAEAADALFAKLTRPVEGVKVPRSRYLAHGFGGEAPLTKLMQKNSVGTKHRNYIDAGMQRLIDDLRVTVSADGTVRVAGALTTAPSIGGISA